MTYSIGVDLGGTNLRVTEPKVGLDPACLSEPGLYTPSRVGSHCRPVGSLYIAVPKKVGPRAFSGFGDTCNLALSLFPDLDADSESWPQTAVAVLQVVPLVGGSSGIWRLALCWVDYRAHNGLLRCPFLHKG
jgi:hypothetical protein